MRRNWHRATLEGVAIVLAVLAGGNSLVRSQEPKKAAEVVVFKKGKGEPRTTHPDRRTKVDGDRLKGPGGKELAKLTKGPSETVACFSFSRDGRLLAVGIRYDSVKENKGKDGTIRGYLRVYDARTGALLQNSGAGIIGPVEHIAFSERGDVVFYQTGKYEEHGGK